MITEIVSVKTENNIVLKGVLFNTNEKSTVAVIAKHGKGGHFASGVPALLCPRLAEKGYTSLAINTRNSCLQYETSLFEDVEMDLRAWVRFMNSKGFKKVVLVGHSLGTSEVVYYLSKTQDPTIKALILFGAHSDMKGMTVERFRAIDPENPQMAYETFLANCRRLVAEGKGDTLLIMPHSYRPPDGPYACPGSPSIQGPLRFICTSARTFISYRAPESDASILKWIDRICVPILLPVHTIVNTGARPQFSKEIQKVANEVGLKCDYVSIKADHSYRGKEEEIAQIVANWLSNIGLDPI